MLAGLSLPRFDGGRPVLAVDASPRLRPDTPCSAERLSCHVYGRAKTASQLIPGWPHSFVAVLEPGATSRTATLDRDPARTGGRRNRDHRHPVARCRRATHRRWSMTDRGPAYPDRQRYRPQRHPPGLGPARPAGRLVGRVRSDRVMRLPKPPRTHGDNSRPPKHGPEFRFAGDLTRARDHHRHGHDQLRQGRNPRHGTGSTQSSPTAPPGPTTTVNFRRSKTR
ncbi:transposase [Streptomyces antimycoticus]|uniref:transposase n=1 Tax=Streptomyces antimycoticus TaxID=68175 RepID=UPI00343A23D1